MMSISDILWSTINIGLQVLEENFHMKARRPEASVTKNRADSS
jgi:hypothetical protein